MSYTRIASLDLDPDISGTRISTVDHVTPVYLHSLELVRLSCSECESCDEVIEGRTVPLVAIPSG